MVSGLLLPTPVGEPTFAADNPSAAILAKMATSPLQPPNPINLPETIRCPHGHDPLMSKPTEQQMANAIRAARHFTFVANGRVRASSKAAFQRDAQLLADALADPGSSLQRRSKSPRGLIAADIPSAAVFSEVAENRHFRGHRLGADTPTDTPQFRATCWPRPLP
jgi:hypothetical protein